MKIKMSTSFHVKALEALSYIADAIEACDKDCIIEMDFTGDVIKLEVPRGEYVINKHSAAQQIWLASPISGPYHFSLVDGCWVNKDKVDLMVLLTKELGELIDIKLG